jgi:predicted nucleotidyltransferase
MKRSDVLRILHEKRGELTEKYGVKSLTLFGSVARDEAHLNSDVDLLVEFDRPVGLFAFIRLQQFLETLLSCKVDLGTLRSLKPQLQDIVLHEAINIF